MAPSKGIQPSDCVTLKRKEHVYGSEREGGTRLRTYSIHFVRFEALAELPQKGHYLVMVDWYTAKDLIQGLQSTRVGRSDQTSRGL